MPQMMNAVMSPARFADLAAERRRSDHASAGRAALSRQSLDHLRFHDRSSIHGFQAGIGVNYQDKSYSDNTNTQFHSGRRPSLNAELAYLSPTWDVILEYEKPHRTRATTSRPMRQAPMPASGLGGLCNGAVQAVNAYQSWRYGGQDLLARCRDFWS